MLGSWILQRRTGRHFYRYFLQGGSRQHWSSAVKRLRGFSSPEALLRTLLLHVGLGYSLRETVVRARLADRADVSDVPLLKRMHNSEQWLRFLCIALLRESGAFVFEKIVGAVGWWMARLSRNLVKPEASGEFPTASNYPV